MKAFRYQTFVFAAFFILFSSSTLYAGESILKASTWEAPPYQLTDESGNITGYLVDLIRAVFKEMNLQIKLIMAPYARCQYGTQKGDFDFYFLAGKTEKRLEWGYFPSESLMIQHWGFSIRKKDEGKIQFRQLEDLKGLNIGVVRGQYYGKDNMEYARKHCKIDYAANDEQNHRKLDIGRVDCIFTEINVSQYLTKKLGIQETVFLTDRMCTTANLYPAFSKKTMTPEFVGKFSETLKRIKSSKLKDDLHKKYELKMLHFPKEKIVWEYME